MIDLSLEMERYKSQDFEILHKIFKFFEIFCYFCNSKVKKISNLYK